MKKTLIHVLATAAALTICGTASAAGGPSGYAVTFKPQGKIGEVVNNPYDIAPLTSVIKNGGWVLKSAHVRVVPKKGGQEVSYDVGPTALRTHGGIPVFGLYADHLNTVEVKYVRVNQGKDETIEEKYQIATPPVWFDPSWTDGKTYKTFDIEVKKKAPKAFADRLYLINNLLPASPKGMRAVWNNPMGGALQWNFYPQNAVVDTQGEVRWYMLPTKIYDPRDIYRAGIMMGFHQNDDGALSFGYGQRYAK
ncbi:aryl-sulfate sulfotransferase N-terminal domain-containing protein, partial [Sutterella parvirubra]